MNKLFARIENTEQADMARVLCNDDYAGNQRKCANAVGGPVVPILMHEYGRWYVGFIADGQSGPGKEVSFNELVATGLKGMEDAVLEIFKTLFTVNDLEKILDHERGGGYGGYFDWPLFTPVQHS